MGIKLGFIATRSGLMRFSDHSALFEDPAEEEKRRREEEEAAANGEEIIREPYDY